MTDLDKLIEAVEVGELQSAMFHGACMKGFSRHHRHSVYLALNGSLDAAKELHDELLPGQHWVIGMSAKTGEATADIAGMDPIEGTVRMADPARAWLLAILKAYRAQVQK